jgi:hypothetical protein
MITINTTDFSDFVILAASSKGSGSNDEARLRELLSEIPANFLPFDRTHKLRSGWNIFRSLMNRPDLMVVEGTGLAVGLPCIASRILRGVRYVVSSGDAVGPYVQSLHPILGQLFSIYERILYRCSAGFVGWTPYLVGRALTFGAPRAMTAPGWGPQPLDPRLREEARRQLRQKWSIGHETIIFGIVGSLLWNNRVGYCYGSELVRAICRNAPSPKVGVVIAGGGTGVQELKKLAGDRLGRDIHVIGEIPADAVGQHLAAFDVASLPQSLDGVGSFRYTTKLSEYLSARLPVVTGQIPMSYDLNTGWLWRLPGAAPWSADYLEALGNLMQTITLEQVAAKQRLVCGENLFNRADQIARMSEFVRDLLHEKQLRPVPQQTAHYAAATGAITDG